MKDSTTCHTVIIGAGAAGLMCAGSFNADKIVIEHNARPGAKLAVSGGGKCNFTNQTVTAAHYQSQSKHFCKNALAAYKNTDFLHLLESAAIPYTQMPSGQYFAQNAQEIVAFLVRRAQEASSRIWLNTQALKVERTSTGFTVRTSRGTVQAGRVVLASGGLSYPALGAGNFGFKTAREMGLTIVEPRPALVGLVLPKALRLQTVHLAGNSLPVAVKVGKFSTQGSLLFTHEGISGPAVLQASLFWQGEPVEINFLPQVNAAEFLRTHKNINKPFSALLADKISPKIAKTLLGELDVCAANATHAQLLNAAERLNRFCVVPAHTAGLTKAEVTAGGVDVRQINPSTLECRQIPGLYIIGELLDVTGLVGGYNLQWAWSSGFCAAQALKNAF